MKVLIATNPKMGNPYTRTLAQRVEEVSTDIRLSVDLAMFWAKEAEEFDIIHIMFPHELLAGSKHTASDLKSRFKHLRDKGIKIVSTCHNLKPHYGKNQDAYDAYSQTYANSDMILHLADYSKSVFDSKYPHAINVLLYHHVYDNIYDNGLSQEQARKKLGLPTDKKYVLSFGIIRDDEERDMLKDLAKGLPKDIKLWAPSFYRVNKSRNLIKYGVNLAKYLHIKLTNSHIKMQHQYVSHDDLPLYFSAADAVFIPRKKILNSGNLPMAFYFGKPVAGPGVGNVGHILKETGNYCFDPDDSNNIVHTVIEAIKHPETGVQNKKLAESQMSSTVIANQLVNLYKSLSN